MRHSDITMLRTPAEYGKTLAAVYSPNCVRTGNGHVMSFLWGLNLNVGGNRHKNADSGSYNSHRRRVHLDEF